jgi:t-SNARE complex subunit (syntaxin)
MLMSIFDIEVFVKDLDKLFNDMQDKAIAGSENVATASWVIKNQANYIKHLEEGLDSSINLNKAQAERQKK